MSGPPRDVDEVVELVVRDAVAAYRARDRLVNDSHAHTERMLLLGEIDGLRAALCRLKGWDPDEEGDKDGKADELVLTRWQELYPKEWL